MSDFDQKLISAVRNEFLIENDICGSKILKIQNYVNFSIFKNECFRCEIDFIRSRRHLNV